MDKLFDCIINKNSSFIPVWFMRQAGRYLPEFRKIRQKNQNFIKLCLEPELVKDITLQPLKRFNLDATIIFSDILMIPYGLGQNVEFKKGTGPVLENFNLDKIMENEPENFIKKMSPIYEAIKKVKKTTKKESLIGFVGAPWTLLVYMLNKQSPKKDFDFNTIDKNKILTKKLLKKLEEIICLHVNKQVEAGANIIQIFDSWAGLLPERRLSDYCFSPTSKIVEYTKSLKIPVICFPKGIGKNYENFCSIVKPNCISIDYDVDPEWIKEKSGGITIQGGMDPKILLLGREKIKNTIEKYLKIFSGYPYIFNLGHGVLPETKPETIEYIVQTVRNKK
tara:strand:- start:1370 stop:2377 length:1008 start_codon:yes stop_codon:yes gene_type:complete